jgi:hypothetical protein
VNKLERLAYWKRIALDAARSAGEDVKDLESRVWKNEEDDLFYYFNFFRPGGEGVDKVFEGIIGGKEIADRLRLVYQATKESQHLYFIVCRSLPATGKRLIELTTQHYKKVAQIAREHGECEELIQLFDKFPKIEITTEPAPDRRQPDPNCPETWVYGVVICDWFNHLEPVQSDALLMEEAFYSIACDYYLAHYLMWPLYRNSTTIEEPFAPYFELWRHGAHSIFTEPGKVLVYVSSDR